MSTASSTATPSPNSLRRFNGVSPRVHATALVDPSAVVIGDVHIGEDSSIWPQVTVRGDVHRIRIGARTSIQDGTVCHVTHAGPFTGDGWPLIVGDDVICGHQVTLHGCTIGNHVLIGIGSVVMDGAVIEDEVMLGANSLVPPGKRLQGGYLYKGSPAKQARPLTDTEKENLRYAAGNYVKLKNQHLQALADM